MDASGGEAPTLECADPERRESLQRENQADPLAGEQTWPTDEVILGPCPGGHLLQGGQKPLQGQLVSDDLYAGSVKQGKLSNQLALSNFRQPTSKLSKSSYWQANIKRLIDESAEFCDDGR